MVEPSELRAAMESGREETIELLAKTDTLPVIDERAEVSDLLGGRKGPSIKLAEGGDVEVIDRQTRQDVLNFLDVDSEEDVASIQETIRSHEAWTGD